MAAVFALIWAFYSMHSFIAQTRLNPWTTGEWLINYEGGFQRRGALGSLTLAASDLLSSPPTLVASVFQSSIAALAIWMLFRLVTRIDVPLALVLVLLGPMGFFYFVTDIAIVGTKEILLYLLTLLWLEHLANSRNNSSLTSMEVLALFGFFGLYTFLFFSHEGFLLYTPVLIWLTIISGNRQSKAHFITSLVRTLPIIAASLTVVPILWASSNTVLGTGACAALVERAVNPTICSGAIQLTSQSAVGSSFTPLIAANLAPWLISYLPGLLVPSLLILSFLSRPLGISRAPGSSKSAWMWLVAFFLCVAPIFVISVDWGRYLSIFFTLVSMSLLFIFGQHSNWGQSITNPRAAEPQPTKGESTFTAIAVLAYYLFFGIAHYGGTYKPLIHGIYVHAARIFELIG
jgi:hypothetical protein